MKAIAATKEKDFDPITLTLTIESRRELEAFYLLAQAAKEDLADVVNKSKKASNLCRTTNEFKWEELQFTKQIREALYDFVYQNKSND